MEALVMYMGLAGLLHHRITITDAARYAAVAAVVTVLALSILYEMHPLGTSMVPPVARVVVSEGDTLWALAQAYGPPQADPRRTVSRIRELNHLDGSLITPGEVVLVPRS
jgi:LysM repeat protein